MTAPTLDPWTYQYKDSGLLLNGPASADFYDVEEITGFDMPDVKQTTVDLDGQHGASVSVRYLNPRTVVMTLTAYNVSTDDIQPMLDQLGANLFPDDITYPLYIQHSGVGLRVLNCKSLGAKYTRNKDNNINKQSIQVTWIAEDPRMYDVVVTTTNINFPTTTVVGRTYPKTYPKTYGATTSGGSSVITNTGSVDTDPVFTFTNASNNITIYNDTTGRSIYLPVTLLAGNVMTVDCKNKIVLLNGVRFNAYQLTNGWISLLPGANNLRVTATFAAVGATGSISYQSAY